MSTEKEGNDISDSGTEWGPPILGKIVFSCWGVKNLISDIVRPCGYVSTWYLVVVEYDVFAGSGSQE